MEPRWGELTTLPDTDSGIVALEREQLIKPRPIDHLDGPLLYQPSTRHVPPSHDQYVADQFATDPVVTHTIQLMQHARKMRNLISTIQHQPHEKDPETGEMIFPKPLPLPEFHNPPATQQLCQPIPFLSKDVDNLSDFVRGRGEPPPVIDATANRRLVQKSVATMCAHAGFDNTSHTVLDILTDVLDEYYTNMMGRLRCALDNHALNGPNGFPDVLEQVYYELGLGSVTSIHEFYQKRVVRYREKVIDTCHQLLADYETQKQTVSSMGDSKSETFTLIKIKEEPYADIQFPHLEEADENDPEQLLQLEGLGSFEITVEQESASGLTTEVDSKWNVKTEPPDIKNVEVDSAPSSVTTIQDSEVQMPHLTEEMVTNPPVLDSCDVISPQSISGKPPPPKKKKK